MIIVILTLTVLLFSYSMVFLKRGLRRQIINALSLVAIVASIGLIAANDNNYLGMKKVSQTQTYTLKSSVATPGTSLLLYHKLGTGIDRIYLYRTTSATKLQKTTLADSRVSLQRNAQQPQLKVRTTRWVYQNKLAQALFSITGENGQLANRQYQFNLPANWQLLDTAAAAKMQQK